MKKLLPLVAGTALTFTPLLCWAQNSWYLTSDPAIADNWNTLADWHSNPAGGGTTPTSISSSDYFYTNGCMLRTPANSSAAPFGGSTLTINGGSLGLKNFTSTAATTIGNLVTRAGTIANANGGGGNLILNITNLSNLEDISFTTGVSTRGLNITIGTLSGDGDTCFCGAGTISLGITTATGYRGSMLVDDGVSLTFPTSFTSSGDLQVMTGAKVILNAAVTFSGLTLNGVAYASGNYSYATLHAAYPAIFTSGTGSITVNTPSAWYLHTNQPLTDNWGTLADWFSAPTGGTNPSAISLADSFFTNGLTLRTPASSAASTFGGGFLTLNGGAIGIKDSSTTTATTINSLTSTGGTISDSSGTAGAMILNLNTFTNLGATVFDAAVSNRGLKITTGLLSGNGDITLKGAGGGTFTLNLADAWNYTGTLTMSGTSTGSLTFMNPITSSGSLVIGAGNTVTLNQNLFFAGLTVGSTVYAPGTYTASALGFSGTGSVRVKKRPSRMYGVNLSAAEGGNNLPGVYTFDYTYPTQAELTYYHGKGQNLIRIPFRWERMQTTMNGPLVTAELGRMDAVVGWAHNLGMKVILDMHNFDRRSVGGTQYVIGTTQVPNAAFQDVWSKLAAHYAGETAIWGYDIMNEPHDTSGTWPAAAQAGVNGVRQGDTVHFVIVEGDSYASALNWQTVNPTLNIADSAGLLIYQAHQYFDTENSDFMAHSGGYDTYAVEHGYPNMGIDQVSPFVNWLKARQAWGMIGEYGVPNNDPRWNVVLDRFLSYLKANGISGTYWRGGPIIGADPLSCEPTSNFTVDAPQMSVLQQYSQ